MRVLHLLLLLLLDSVGNWPRPQDIRRDQEVDSMTNAGEREERGERGEREVNDKRFPSADVCLLWVT